MIFQSLKGMRRELEIVMGIPGIGFTIAASTLAEIGDIKVFPEPKNLVSWSGLAPAINESAGKTSNGHITKRGNKFLRTILVQAANSIAIGKHNKLWFFHEDRLGSVLWHNTNRIELLLSGKKDVARAKTLFCRAFLDMIGDIKELDQQFLKGEIETKHHVFKIGESLPLFNIDFFAASHGLTIYTDGSHPDSLEVSEAKPFWLDELHEIRQGFKEDMGKHMELLNQMKTMQDRLASKVNPQQEQRGKKISLALKRIHELKRIGRMRSLFK